MSGYPRTRDEREALRVRYAERAAYRAYLTGRSLKCLGESALSQPGVEMHADDPNGCRNDGGGCLCPCHDTKGGDDE